MRFDSYGTMRAAVRAGIGAHMLWRDDVRDDPDLVELPTASPTPLPSLWVLTLDELKSNSRVRVASSVGSQLPGPTVWMFGLPKASIESSPTNAISKCGVSPGSAVVIPMP